VGRVWWSPEVGRVWWSPEVGRGRWCAEGPWCASPGCVIVLVGVRRSYPGAADPGDNKSGSLGPPVSVALPPARSGEGPNGSGIAPNRRLTSSRRAYPTALPVRQPSDQRSTPPGMGQPHPRKVLPGGRKPIPGEGEPSAPTGWHQQPRPRTPCRARGHVIPCPGPRRDVRAANRQRSGVAVGGGPGHQLGPGVTSYLVRTPDLVSVAPTWCPGLPAGAGFGAVVAVRVYRGTGGIRQKRARGDRLSVAIGCGGRYLLSVGTPTPEKRTSCPLGGDKFAYAVRSFHLATKPAPGRRSWRTPANRPGGSHGPAGSA